MLSKSILGIKKKIIKEKSKQHQIYRLQAITTLKGARWWNIILYKHELHSNINYLTIFY